MDPVKIFYIVLSAFFAFIIVRTTVKGKILEKDSLVWLLIAIITVILGVFPQLIKNAAKLFGIEYAPSLLFLLSTLVLIFFIVRQSMQIVALHQKVRDLAQRGAIMEEKLKRLLPDENLKDPPDGGNCP